MTIEQLARSTRSVFEQHYVSLTGLPFFTSFPLNCCQGASVVFGMLVSLLPTRHSVTVVKGYTRNRRESQGWSMACPWLRLGKVRISPRCEIISTTWYQG